MTKPANSSAIAQMALKSRRIMTFTALLKVIKSFGLMLNIFKVGLRSNNRYIEALILINCSLFVLLKRSLERNVAERIGVVRLSRV